MKLIQTILLLICIPLTSLCQLKEMGLKKQVAFPKPQMEIIDNTLYVATENGIYRKDLQLNTDWELFKFKGRQVLNFIHYKRNWMVSFYHDYAEVRKDSMLIVESLDDNTEVDCSFIESGTNYILLAQAVSTPEATLYAVAHNGIYQSDDFGKNWEYLQFNVGSCYGITISPHDANNFLYYGEGNYFNGFIGCSTDAGKTWDFYNAPGGDDQITDVVFSHDEPNTVLYVSSFGKIGKSTDAGKSWEMVYGIEPNGAITSNCAFYDIVEDTKAAGTFYASGWQHDTEDVIYIYRTKDHGDTWEIAWKENLQGEGHVKVLNTIMYNDELILLTNAGLYSLNVKTTPEASDGQASSIEMKKTIEKDDFIVQVIDRQIYVTNSGGTPIDAEVYSMTGTRMETGVNLPVGFYIVKVNGKSEKVVIK